MHTLQASIQISSQAGPNLASPFFLTISSLYAPESFTFFIVPLSDTYTFLYEKVPSTIWILAVLQGPSYITPLHRVFLKHYTSAHKGLFFWTLCYALDSGTINLDT